MLKAGGVQEARCKQCSQASAEEVPWEHRGGGRASCGLHCPLVGGVVGTDRDRESSLGDGNDVDRCGENKTIH